MTVSLGESNASWDRTTIENTLPHRHPFLFLDTASLFTDAAEGTYAITGKEFFLPGHFKDEPVFPASLMLEGLGQLGALFLLTTQHAELAYPVDNRRVLFVSSERISCHNIARPGQTLAYSIQLSKLRPPFIKFHGKITIEGKKIASIEDMTLAFDYKKK